MEGVLSIVDNIGRFIAFMGMSLSVIFFVYSGILFMMAQGDPQKSAQARSAFIGVVVGLCVVGLAFMVPEVVSRTVIVPAGGIAVRGGVDDRDCDGLLRRQLVVQRGATTPERMNRVIQTVQGRFEACDPYVWNPVVETRGTQSKAVADMCGTQSTGGTPTWPTIGALYFPPGLSEVTSSLQPTGKAQAKSTRDRANNILVLWDQNNKPWDTSTCWVYFGRFDTWRTG